MAFICDQAVGEVSAFVENRQTGLCGWTVHGDIAGVEQGFERGGNVLLPETVNPTQYPDELAQAGQGNGDEFGFFEKLRGAPRLFSSSRTTKRTSTLVSTVIFTFARPSPSQLLP